MCKGVVSAHLSMNTCFDRFALLGTDVIIDAYIIVTTLHATCFSGVQPPSKFSIRGTGAEVHKVHQHTSTPQVCAFGVSTHSHTGPY